MVWLLIFIGIQFSWNFCGNQTFMEFIVVFASPGSQILEYILFLNYKLQIVYLIMIHVMAVCLI